MRERERGRVFFCCKLEKPISSNAYFSRELYVIVKTADIFLFTNNFAFVAFALGTNEIFKHVVAFA